MGMSYWRKYAVIVVVIIIGAMLASGSFSFAASAMAPTAVNTCKIQVYGKVTRQNTGGYTGKSYIQAVSSKGALTKYTVDKNGQYEISDLADGKYAIKAVSEEKSRFLDSMEAEVTVKKGACSIRRIYFTLPKIRQDEYSCNGLWPGGKQLVGRVDGPPGVLFEGYVLLSGSGGFSKKAEVDETDQYSFIGLKNGTYTISAVPDKPCYMTGGMKKTVVVSGGVCTPNRYDFAYCTTTLENYVLEKRRKASLPKNKAYVPEGLNPDGSQLNGYLKGVPDTRFEGRIAILGRYGSYYVPISPDNKFSAKGMQDGKYIVTAVPSGKDYFCTSKPAIVAVEDGVCTPNGIIYAYASAITGTSTPLITGTVMDGNGKPSGGSHVDVMDSSGKVVLGTGVNKDDAKFQIYALKPGIYTIVASPAGESIWSKSKPFKLVVSKDPKTGCSVYKGPKVIIALTAPEHS